jgi:hypothetical protein
MPYRVDAWNTNIGKTTNAGRHVNATENRSPRAKVISPKRPASRPRADRTASSAIQPPV